MMLSSLLPGLRDVRTPLAVGYMLVFGVVVTLISFHLNTDSAARLLGINTDEVASATKVISSVGALGVVSFVAYSIGTILTIPTESDRMTKRFMEGLAWPKMLGWMLPYPETATTVEYHHFVDRAESSAKATQLEIRNADAFSSDLERARVAGVRSLRAALLSKSQSVYGEYDRLAAEAAFRVNVGTWSAVTTLALAFVTTPWSLLSWVISAALIRQGLVRIGAATETLQRAAIVGAYSHPIIEVSTTIEKKAAQEASMARQFRAWGQVTNLQLYANDKGQGIEDIKAKVYLLNDNQDSIIHVTQLHRRIRLVHSNSQPASDEYALAIDDGSPVNIVVEPGKHGQANPVVAKQ